MIKPNLFLIGAMKSGTRHLVRLLRSHPSIFMCLPEEPSYFVEPNALRKLWPAIWEEKFWSDEALYLELFQDAAGSKWVGEASTAYSKLPLIQAVPDRIAAYSSKARFIYVMRDPGRRTLSHYWWNVRFHGETRDPLDAIKQDAQYCDYSYYAMQLAPYFDQFGRDRIALITHEELISKPQQTLAALYDWLDVDADHRPEEMDRPTNATPQSLQQVSGLGTLHRIRQSRAWGRLRKIIPAPLRQFARARAYENVDREHIDQASVKNYLRPIQWKQTKELSRLLDRQFPEWTTLTNSANDPLRE